MSDQAITRNWTQADRQAEILRLTRESGRCAVTDLAERFGVTTETIRRDLSDMQKRRLVRRLHGAAVPWSRARFEPNLAAREGQQVAEKRQIATAALRELPQDGTIILDAGSTTSIFAGYLPQDRNLRVVTNSLSTARILTDHKGTEVIVVGGRVRLSTLTMTDPLAVEMLGRMTVDTLFVGTDGISAERGFTTPYQDEVAVKGAMIAAARRVVVLADHSKFHHDHFLRFAGMADVDTLITDQAAPERALDALRVGGVDVVIA